MRRRLRHIVLSLALASALASVLVAVAAVFATPAPVQPTPVDPRIEAKKAEKKTALDELERMRQDLAAQVAEYVETGRKIERTKQDIGEVTLQIEQMDLTVDRAQEAIDARAVQMYRGGQVTLLQILLTAESIPDLMERMTYLVASSRHDARLLAEVRIARQESLWLQESLNERVDMLVELQTSADERRSRIESDMAAQEAKAQSIGEDIVRLMREAREVRTFGGGQPEGQFIPDTVISDALFYDASSMTLLEIQKFLEQQPGTLKNYRAPDYSGEVKTAAQMIFEASAAHGISPKVILVKLQKEQSLLERRSPTQNAYDWAMGCGKADSRTYYQYQGFGKQIWFGAYKLKKNADPWRPGIEMKIDGNVIRPTNRSTYSLYKYTPHLRGTMSFWLLYWRYFGDPLASPPSAPH